MAKISISYRRDDTADASGRIYDRLEQKYERENVFKDVDAIPLGVDFRTVLTDEVAKCDVMLVVIGRLWVNITDEDGHRRLDNPDDFVRIEVEAALKRDIPVIPVLVQNVFLPKERDLPSTLAQLVYQNAISLGGDPYFLRDMDLLIGRLDEQFTTVKTLDSSDKDEVQLNVATLIHHKREGGVFTQDLIHELIGAYTRGDLPDYQMSALLMAICFRGMTQAETVGLTLAMADSGERLVVREQFNPIADKHSTGGVGDKLTLVVAPLVAACGLPVAKMSGRGLGHTGGTIDKLEAISGMRTDLSRQAVLDGLHAHGMVLAAQSAALAPADGKLYALRDVTATVDSIPLIAASIMIDTPHGPRPDGCSGYVCGNPLRELLKGLPGPTRR